jgi:hypothetical protein
MPSIAPRPAVPHPAPVGRTFTPHRAEPASYRVAAPSQDGGPSSPDDAWRLMVLFLVFVVTPIVVVVALWAAVAIGTWWALVVLVGVHFTTTAVVFAVVSFVMSGHMPRAPHRSSHR